MICCGVRTGVLETTPIPEGTKRRRICFKCQRRYTTIELSVPAGSKRVVRDIINYVSNKTLNYVKAKAS